jgi:hypothetical protein
MNRALTMADRWLSADLQAVGDGNEDEDGNEDAARDGNEDAAGRKRGRS